ncbi:hypothetical protein P7K49_021157 [Saguinus oedipus]|uniref:Spermatogenesis associated 19 n=1 Tax=Saguinus oedipus TaxID=9490 RepID=A0ABQ9URW0_SAGOE|nr:hypothetical protein P7K49_021157 [Saguinus oedipus]
MIITTWIVYILARKGVGLPFLPITSSDIDVVESEALSVVQHWLKKTEEEASQGIKEKLSVNYPSQGIMEKTSIDSPPTRGQDIHVTRDVVKHHLSKSDLSANQSQEVLEERTRIQFIRWSHTRIFQVPSEITEDIMRDRIEQHITFYGLLISGLQYETLLLGLLRATGLEVKFHIGFSDSVVSESTASPSFIGLGSCGSPSGSRSNPCQKNIHLLLDLKKGQTWAERLQQVSSSCNSVSTGVFFLNCK